MWCPWHQIWPLDNIMIWGQLHKAITQTQGWTIPFHYCLTFTNGSFHYSSKGSSQQATYNKLQKLYNPFILKIGMGNMIRSTGCNTIGTVGLVSVNLWSWNVLWSSLHIPHSGRGKELRVTEGQNWELCSHWDLHSLFISHKTFTQPRFLRLSLAVLTSTAEYLHGYFNSCSSRLALTLLYCNL